MRDKAVDWQAVRQVWEADEREGWLWIKAEMGLPVAVQSIRYQAKKNHWEKKPQSYMAALYGPTISTDSQYRKLFAPATALLALSGHTLPDIAATFNAAPELFKEWMQAYPELAEALEKGSRMADAEVAHALHRAATGYDQEEQQVVTDGQGRTSVITITKHYPPDAELARWWQENRNAQKTMTEGQENA